nr:DpnD/PcfM family protein [uncultured Fretibacterium sp.]
MGRYKVEIVEKISMPVEVDAPTAEAAILQVIKKYRAEQIVVESDEGAKVEFFASRVKA